jgi:hypothetical protein
MPLTSCQSSMTLAAGAESSKVYYKPLHHAGNCNNIVPIPINTFATLPACISRSPRLARQAQFCDRTLSPLSGPLKTIMAVPINSVRMLISNSLLPHAFPKVAIRELQVNVWVIFLPTIMRIALPRLPFGICKLRVKLGRVRWMGPVIVSSSHSTVAIRGIMNVGAPAHEDNVNCLEITPLRVGRI